MRAQNIKRLVGASMIALSVLLVGCAGTVKHDASSRSDVGRVPGVSKVVVTMSPEAAKLLADNPQFNREEIATRLRYQLEAKGLTAPSAAHRVEIEVTDIRVRGAFAAVMFGFMAGDDHVTGRVRVVDAAGNTLRSFQVNASYALGGLAGGQDGMRMNWMYDKFAELSVTELQKMVDSPQVGTGLATPTAAVIAPAVVQPVSQAGAVPTAATKTTN
jgi:hypothetical protein